MNRYTFNKNNHYAPKMLESWFETPITLQSNKRYKRIPTRKKRKKDVTEISKSNFIRAEKRKLYFKKDSKNQYNTNFQNDNEVQIIEPPNVIDLTIKIAKKSKFSYNAKTETNSNFGPINKIISFEKRLKEIKKSFKAKNGIQQTQVRVPLFDTITLLRLKTPARGKNCSHVASFELDTFISQLNCGKNRSKCPLCAKRLEAKSVVIDGYLKRILDETENEEAKFVCILKTGQWRLDKDRDKSDDMLQKDILCLD